MLKRQKSSETLQRVGMALPRELVRALRIMAAVEDVTMPALICRVLTEWVTQQTQQAQQSTG